MDGIETMADTKNRIEERLQELGIDRAEAIVRFHRLATQEGSEPHTLSQSELLFLACDRLCNGLPPPSSMLLPVCIRGYHLAHFARVLGSTVDRLLGLQEREASGERAQNIIKTAFEQLRAAGFTVPILNAALGYALEELKRVKAELLDVRRKYDALLTPIPDAAEPTLEQITSWVSEGYGRDSVAPRNEMVRICMLAWRAGRSATKTAPAPIPDALKLTERELTDLATLLARWRDSQPGASAQVRYSAVTERVESLIAARALGPMTEEQVGEVERLEAKNAELVDELFPLRAEHERTIDALAQIENLCGSDQELEPQEVVGLVNRTVNASAPAESIVEGPSATGVAAGRIVVIGGTQIDAGHVARAILAAAQGEVPNGR